MTEWVLAYTGPDTIKIGAIDYKIMPMTPEEVRRDEALGKCDNENAEISVVFDRTPRVGAVTLLHEIMHAIWYVQDLRGKEKEERVVSALSAGLAAAMRDNPKVFAWIGKTLV